MLILFDIDATLITTSRSGIAAMGLAGRALYGSSFDESVVQYAGRLDPLIINELLVAHDVEVSSREAARFRAAYREHLIPLLAQPGQARACPGVINLLDALAPFAERGDIALGLLTGNFPETGAIKLRASGVDPDRFAIHVWGSDSPHSPPARDHLPPVGIARYHEHFGAPVRPEHVTIIGDTPHDIRCAHVNGCRALAVATGSFSVEDLADADLAVYNLCDTQRMLDWLTNSSENASSSAAR